MKNILTHLFIFLLGLLSATFYYSIVVYPNQIEHLRNICTESDLGYPGDWVLDILFPVIPTLLIVGIVLIGLKMKKKMPK